jgi:hypothetical protein
LPVEVGGDFKAIVAIVGLVFDSFAQFVPYRPPGFIVPETEFGSEARWVPVGEVESGKSPEIS